MAIFRYEVADTTGKVMRGAMDAPSAQEVSRRLFEQGYDAVQVLPATTGEAATATVATSSASRAAAAGSPSPGAALGPSAKPEQIGSFFRQLASLIHSGFSVSSAFSDLGMRSTNRGIGEAAKRIAAGSAQGQAVAPQMAQFGTLFPPHVTGLVAAGETGGFLEFAFEEAALNMEQDAALTQGLWLPRVLIWQAIWSVLLLVPLFPSINPEDLKASGIAYGRALVFVVLPLGIGMHVASVVLGKLWNQPLARRFHDALSLRIPVMSKLAKMRALASFTRVLRRLLMSGISPEPAFVGAARAVPNTVLSERILQTGAPLVRAHEGIDKAIAATGLMGDDPLQLLITGQKTGQWMEMLDRVTAYYQEEAARATEAAKNAQKRAGVLITLLSMGYVTIALTVGLYNLVFKFTDSFGS
ncbi:MAG: type II secretion system F family protein [Cytophagales bacterium]|nr:type II secretion system F family protein [Armatimonadota bacterium]